MNKMFLDTFFVIIEANKYIPEEAKSNFSVRIYSYLKSQRNHALTERFTKLTGVLRAQALCV